jgi:hypothetical protein
MRAQLPPPGPRRRLRPSWTRNRCTGSPPRTLSRLARAAPIPGQWAMTIAGSRRGNTRAVSLDALRVTLFFAGIRGPPAHRPRLGRSGGADGCHRPGRRADFPPGCAAGPIRMKLSRHPAIIEERERVKEQLVCIGRASARIEPTPRGQAAGEMGKHRRQSKSAREGRGEQAPIAADGLGRLDQTALGGRAEGTTF